MSSKELYREDKKHLPLNELKHILKSQNIYHKCIRKTNIPTYPRPELRVSHVSHSTDRQGLRDIVQDGAFRDPKPEHDPKDKVVWFSLTVSPDELRDAETRDMMLVLPGGHEEVLRPKEDRDGYWEDWEGHYNEDEGGLVGPLPEGGKLRDFAKSPAFRSRSRYGSFRFTFSLRDVLEKYRQQFCCEQQPVMRVFRTVVYKQEVMYAVLVHSPSNNKKFSEFPLLEETPHCICAFRAKPDPHFVWRPQAMSGTHRFGLTVENGTLFTKDYVYEHYVWDNVALALHVEDERLMFEDHELRKALRFCEKDDITVNKDDRSITFQSFDDAEAEVRKLWPHHRLEKFNKSGFHIQD